MLLVPEVQIFSALASIFVVAWSIVTAVEYPRSRVAQQALMVEIAFPVCWWVSNEHPLEVVGSVPEVVARAGNVVRGGIPTLASEVVEPLERQMLGPG